MAQPVTTEREMPEERFDPTAPDKRAAVVAGHIARYEKAARILLGCKTVVDAACGLGHGTALLDSMFYDVAGVDCSEEAIEECWKRHSETGARFLRVDLKTWDWPSVDAIVSVDTIEHFEDPEPVVARMMGAADKIVLAWPAVRNSNPFHLSFIGPDEVRRWFRNWDLLHWEVEPGSRGRYFFTAWSCR